LEEVVRFTGHAIKLCLAVGFALGLLVLAARTQSRSFPDLSLPDELISGGPLPKYADCQYYNFYGGTAYCRFGTLWTMSYDYTKSRVDCVYRSKELDGLLIGELIQMWGPPTAVSPYGYSSQLYWSNRAAYVSYYLGDRMFSPSSPVTFISYCADVRTGERWRGFRQIE
jgi:hypothetical protein